MYSSVFDRPLSGGLRIGVFDTSVLTQDITATLKRRRPSSILDGMRYGTLRGFIPHYVWAEVPRVLSDLKNEGRTSTSPQRSNCGGATTSRSCTSSASTDCR
ncbi:hypothetical protein SGRIM119S_02961 [Streptomyces griseorubiginosus]